MTLRLRRHALPFAVLLALVACGRDDAADPVVDDAGSAPAAADRIESPDAAGGGTAVALDAASIDALARGIAAENRMLAAVAERMPGAKDDVAKLALMTEIEPARLEAAGAGAAGMSTEAYRARKDALFTVVGQAEMRALLEQQFADVDTTGLDEATAAEARRNVEALRAELGDPYAGLDAAAAEAVRARLPELTELRATHIGLLFKAAGG